MISVTDNLRDFTRGLDTVARTQVPFATAQAITFTAKASAVALKAELAQVFDSPTAFVRNSPYSTSATKASLEATIGIRDKGARAAPAQYIKEHFSGGGRDGKPFERVLRGLGALPDGYKAIPASGMKTDRNGNPDRKALTELIGALKTGFSVFAGKGKRSSQVGYFVVIPGTAGPRTAHLTPGIWRRIQRGADRTAVPVMIFAEQSTYTKALDLPALVEATVRDKFGAIFAESLDNAVRTAR